MTDTKRTTETITYKTFEAPKQGKTIHATRILSDKNGNMIAVWPREHFDNSYDPLGPVAFYKNGKYECGVTPQQHDELLAILQKIKKLPVKDPSRTDFEVTPGLLKDFCAKNKQQR